MDASYLNNLYILSFLDSLNLGLIMPILNPHLLSIGGTHTATGLLVSFHCIAQIISTTFIKGLYQKYNKRAALFYTLTVALISNLILAISTNFWVIFVARLAFYVTNQTQTVLHRYIEATEHNSKHNIINGVFGALGVAGFLVGPILSGYIFQWNHGFTLVSLLAAGISLLSILLVQYLPILPNETESIPDLSSYIINELKVSSHRTKTKLQKANVKCNWSIYVMKALVTTSLTSFFMKFSMLLKIHYNASSVIIGYTVAYQSMIMFLMNFVVVQIKSYLSPDSKVQLVQILSSSVIAMSAICYALSHGLYMAFFIPLALCRLLLDAMWPSSVFAGRGQEITDGAGLVTTVTAIVVPTLLGHFCDMYDDQAVKMFSIAPLLFAILLTLRGFEPLAVQQQMQSESQSTPKLLDNDISEESQDNDKRYIGLKDD